MYRHLWSNGPKECIEFPHYTFEDHFGKAIPSFPPREVLFDYLQGRWAKEDIKKYIQFSNVVRDVVYNDATNNFTISVKDLIQDKVLDSQTLVIILFPMYHTSKVWKSFQDMLCIRMTSGMQMSSRGKRCW